MHVIILFYSMHVPYPSLLFLAFENHEHETDVALEKKFKDNASKKFKPSHSEEINIKF